MANQTNLTINDGQATPVAVVFSANGAFTNSSPRRVEANWLARASSTFRGGMFSIDEYHTPSNANGYEKLKFVISLPKLETVGAVAGSGYQAPPKVAFTDTVEVIVTTHDRSTASNLSDVAAFLANFASNTWVRDKIKLRDRTTG